MAIRSILLILWIAIVLPSAMHAQQREMLDWNFFKNDRPSNGEWQAFTWYNLSYTYKVTAFDGNTAKLTFNVVSKMDTAKSYFEAARRLRNDTYLLKHEQGHADIVFIYAIKLRDLYAKSTFLRKSYQAQAKEIFDRVFAEMRVEQARYDNEVNHGKNRDAQEKWNNYFQKIIAEINRAQYQ